MAHGEVCRRCADRDWPNGGDTPAAVGIVWGKLVDKEALGPRCLDCIYEQLGRFAGDDFYKHPANRSWAIHWLPSASLEVVTPYGKVTYSVGPGQSDTPRAAEFADRCIAEQAKPLNITRNDGTLREVAP